MSYTLQHLTILVALVQGCNSLLCPYLYLPAGTNRSSDDTHIGARVTWWCLNDGDAFYATNVTELQTECQPNGEWNPLPQVCKSMKCGPSPLVPFSVPITDDTRVSIVQLYRCLYGFGFPDNAATKTTQCMEDTLEWGIMAGLEHSTGNITCLAKFCPNLPPVLRTVYYEGDRDFTAGVGLSVGTYINGYCKDGYRKNSVSVMQRGRCSASTNYDINFSECNPEQCRRYTMPNVVRSNDLTSYGQRTKWTCPEGEKFPDGHSEIQAQCTNVGQWNTEPPLSGCTAGGCDEGWLLFNKSCYLISDGTSFGLRYWFAEERCSYFRSNLVYINSLEENIWLYSHTYKLYGKDFWIGFYRDNRYSNDWSWTSDNNITYTRWPRGYPEIDNCARISVNGIWKDRDCHDPLPYVCRKPAKCSAPPEITNGYIEEPITIGMDVGDTVKYICNEGYSFPADGTTEKVVTCVHGSYFSKLENCQRTKCTPINRLGYHVRNALPDTQDNSYLTNITWTCKPGYIYPDGTYSKVMMCQKDRTWDEIPPMCIKAYCKIPAAEHGQPERGVKETGDADVYTCEPGYEFEDGAQLKNFYCDLTGEWNPQENCVRRTCDPYIQLNGNVSYIKLEPNSVTPLFNDAVIVTCHRGFLFPDRSLTKQTTCGPDYRWLPYLPSCEPLNCPGGGPPIVSNARTNETKNSAKTRVLYSCINGYKFIDGETTKEGYCDGATLQWIDIPVGCINEKIIENGVDLGIDAAVSKIIATIAIILIITLFFVLICLECQEGRKSLGICQPECAGSDNKLDEEMSYSSSSSGSLQSSVDYNEERRPTFVA